VTKAAQEQCSIVCNSVESAGASLQASISKLHTGGAPTVQDSCYFLSRAKHAGLSTIYLQ
jgi:hypothetical protein